MHMYSAKVVIAIVASFISIMIFSVQPLYAQSFQQALLQAYQTNPSLQSERSLVREVQEGIPLAKAGWRPTVSAQAGTGVAYQVFDTSSANQKPSEVSVSVSQPLYSGGRTIAETHKARSRVMQERARLVEVEQRVLTHAAISYLDVLQGQQIVDLYKNNEQMMQAWLKEVNQRFILKDKTKTDIDQAKSRLANSEAELNIVENRLQEARSSYLRFIGTIPDIADADKWPVFSQDLPATRDAALVEASQDSPVVQQAFYADKADASNIDSVRSRLLPDVSVRGDYRRTWNENVPQQLITANNTEEGRVMLQLSVPLYSGGANYTRLRAAYQDKTAKQKAYEESRREAMQQTAQAWDRMKMTKDNIRVRQQEVVAATAALQGMKKEERVGDRSSTDRLDAQQQLLDARVGEVQARHDYSVAVVRMMASLGDFTAEFLQLPVSH